MKTLLTACSLALALALSACGADDKKSDGGKGPGNGGAFELNDLAGRTYQTDCWQDAERQRSELDVAVFHGDSFEKIWSNFDGVACAPEARRTTYVYKLLDVTKEATSDLAGWESYSYSYDSIMTTLHQPAIVEAFNRGQIYGYSDWVLNEPKDVAGRKYDATIDAKPAKGAVRVVTVKIETSKFSLAAYKDGKATADDPLVYKHVP